MRQIPLRTRLRRRTQGTLLLIYLDELTLSGLLAAKRVSKSVGLRTVHVLEALPGGLRGRVLRAAASALGIMVSPTAFFAGHLRANGDEVAHLAALRRSIAGAHDAAKRAIEGSSLLQELSAAWGRAPIEIRIARAVAQPVFETWLRIEVARALGAATGTHLIVRRTPLSVTSITADADHGLHWYGQPRIRTLLGHRLLALWWLRQRIAGLAFRIRVALGLDQRVLDAASGAPSVLMPQEEETSTDWSYRTQPHWLAAGSPTMRVVRIGNLAFRDAPEAKTSAAGALLSPGEFHAIPGDPRVKNALRAALSHVSRAALFARSEELPALAAVGRLLYYAERMAAVSSAAAAKVFVSSENVMIHADAMQMVAEASGVHTVSFQYSNMSQVTPAMKTALSVMATFAPFYHERWRWPAWQGRIVDMGYPFDYVFSALRNRADEHRRTLSRNGAKFVLAYFDESVQHDRWGLISVEDHERDMGLLLDLLSADASMGLVLKVQFQRNAAAKMPGLAKKIEVARATGRLLELSHGVHRNRVFPSEAALTADLTIGHAVGATASLEAALAGRRSLLLNPYGFTGANDTIYSRADIVYRSMGEALDAVSRHRRGEPRAARLGDWSEILPVFDAFRDGRAADRMRKFIETLLSGETADAAAAPSVDAYATSS